ncbi:SDR family oxidoreductase, partial [Paenibacillus sepulcri]|nr:SDR family oxidoreductase [Paenibacillus sepulcri]
MDLQLKGKTALVTGSTAGIGKAIAAALAREGATVLINGRHPDKVNAVIQEIGAQYPGSMLKPAAADLGTEQGCQDIIGQFPEIEILVNNLGIFEPADFFEIRDEDWFRFFEVNIMSGVRLSRHYLNGMIGR